MFVNRLVIYMNEELEYYTDSEKFFNAIKLYAKEINGKVLIADQYSVNMPNVAEPGCYFGFVVYYDNEGKYEKAKYFLINSRYLVDCNPLIWEALKSNMGKQNLAKNLSYNGNFSEVFTKSSPIFR